MPFTRFRLVGTNRLWTNSENFSICTPDTEISALRRDDDPAVDLVNDAPTIEVTANDFTENGASANDVAATYLAGEGDDAVGYLVVSIPGPIPTAEGLVGFRLPDGLELPTGVEASRRLLAAHARTAAYAGRPAEADDAKNHILFRDRNCDSLIAVGGGSVMDTAKAVNILVSEGGEFLRAYVGAHALTRPLKPLVAIATTAGTGSEVTSVAVIKDTHKQKKDAFQSAHLLPAVAVIDPRMTLTVPPGMTAATAMDALTHAVEAFTCLAKNPLSDAYASAAIRKIVKALPIVLADPRNTDARLDLAEAATMAGIAFSNSMVGLVHAIGHSLGAVCHLHHGTCMSLLLPYVLEYNFDTIRDDLGQLLPSLVGDEAAAAVPPEDRAKAAIAAIRDLRDVIYRATELPRCLSESGKVDRTQFAQIADLAVDDVQVGYLLPPDPPANDDCASAEAIDVSVDAAIDPAGDEDWYYFDANDGDCVTLATFSLNGSTTDTQIYLYEEATCGDPSAWLVWNDDGGPGLFSLIEELFSSAPEEEEDAREPRVPTQ